MNPHKKPFFYNTVSAFLVGSFLFTAFSGITAEESDGSGENDFYSHFEKNVKKVTLKNGLRLIMVKRNYAPTVACYIKFRAGGVDETERTAGIAHMLEHMLFKGTRDIGTIDYRKEKKYIELVNTWAGRADHWKREEIKAKNSGDLEYLETASAEKQKWTKRLASISELSRKFIILDEDSNIYSTNGQQGYNAYTSKDLTNYQIQLPANRLELWARMESDRIANSVLRDFYTERDVVTEERRMRIENVSKNLLFEKFIEEIYGDHPYGRSLIGSMESIQNLNYEQAMSFYKTYYAPNNTVITLAGDIDFQETEALIEKYFGNLKPKIIPETKTFPLPEKNVRLELKNDGSPVHILAWTKPVFPDPADLHLAVAAKILAGGKDSRLFRKLVLEKNLAAETAAFSGYPGERYTNLLMILTVPAPEKSYDEIESAIKEEIKNIAENGITEEELRSTVNNIEAEFIYGLQNNDQLADDISYYELITGDYRNIYRYIKELKKITSSDIQSSVRKYLSENSMHSARLIQKENSK